MKERAAVVTGAASGIGRAIAQRLHDDGWRVLAVDLRPDPSGPGEPFEADLTAREDNERCVAAALERFGRLDALVPNAGVQHVARVADFPADRWEQIVALLLTSPFLLARAAWPALRATGDGRIVVVASVHGLVASPYKAAYVASKHGVVGLTKTLALEGAADGIRAVALCPGYVRTPLVERQIPEQAATHGMGEDEVLEQVILAPHAVKELIAPEDVAAAVAFLLGDAGRAFTGGVLPMDQGWSAR